jgi:hypothetical protein
MEADFATADRNYTVGRDKGCEDFYIDTERGESLRAKTDGELLHLFEKEIRFQLQELRRDLYFVHGAVLQFHGKACMLIGPTKSGKSTTTWALLRHGFSYLSDELAPVDSKNLHVYPYPRAIWLRRVAPGAQESRRKIETSWMLCIPTNQFPKGTTEKPIPLGALFFVRYDPGSSQPSLRTVPKSVAAAKILSSALNPGTHSGNGLDAAIEIAMHTRCFELFTASLPETCAIIRNSLTDCI